MTNLTKFCHVTSIKIPIPGVTYAVIDFGIFINSLVPNTSNEVTTVMIIVIISLFTYSFLDCSIGASRSEPNVLTYFEISFAFFSFTFDLRF